ncbi:MAG: nitroreductase family protein [Zoogloeaceae bacterium]|jgi:nitroreductase|nr:nitroreductase family protein [Zoogloeaceae bacterium]
MTRPLERGIDPIFINRWSPRAFDESGISESELLQFLEAARWAPSAYNAQPWRFVYARRGTAHWQPFLDLLVPYNRDWAQRASAIVFVLAAQKFTPEGAAEAIETGYAAYDTGAAVAYLTLQASISGWHSHIIAGFDRDAAKTLLKIPEGYAFESAVVIGRQGDPSTLPPALQERETPTPRASLEQLVAEGVFTFK